MENQIKQQYLDLEADRTSSRWMASNQLRLWFSAFALLLFQRLRTLALHGTELANATAGTIRQRLLKIGALVTVSTRRVYVRLASAFPLQKLFAQAVRALAGSLGARRRVIFTCYQPPLLPTGRELAAQVAEPARNWIKSGFEALPQPSG